MDSPKFYREKADHCERLAAKCFDGEVKRKLTTLSLWWRERADEEEAISARVVNFEPNGSAKNGREGVAMQLRTSLATSAQRLL